MLSKMTIYNRLTYFWFDVCLRYVDTATSRDHIDEFPH